MKKKTINIVMTGALAMGVLSAASLPAFAASNSAMNDETKAKVESVMNNLRTKLQNLGVELPEKKGLFEGLDSETKIKAEAIWEKKKAGELTEEQAQKQLTALGVTLPERGAKKDHLIRDVEQANLNEAEQVKAEAILAKAEDGSITHDEAEAQLAALGITIEERGGKGGFLSNVDEETKAKAEAILEQQKEGAITKEEADAQLQKLGITRPERPDLFAGLDEAEKTKAEAIMKQLHEGTISHDQAEAQLEALGVKLPEHGEGKGGPGQLGKFLQGADEETKAEIENLIEEAEEQLETLGVENMPRLK